MRPDKRAVLITGPTASGKSALAVRRAKALGGVVINADAMQVYEVLRVLTARPAPDEMSGVPHRLYGMVDPATRFSTGAWRRAAAAELAAAGDRPVVFVGGTGLYFEALEHGFAEVPAVPAEAVAAAERELAGLDAGARARLLAARDPDMAARLPAADPQRVVRALAVLAATGRSLASFQDAAQRGLLDDHAVERIVLDPGREVVRGRIATRFAAMLEGGAVEEVAALLAMGLDPGLPAMKAIGVREIAAWQRGDIDRDTALTQAVIVTRQYAKRQRTWFRGRMAAWQWVTGDG
jgi:tRNA dimethylallyltransferase